MEYLHEKSLILEEQWNFIHQFQLKELFWDNDAIRKTKIFMNSIFDCLKKDRAKRLQNRKRMVSDPITKKYERMGLEQKIGKGLKKIFVVIMMGVGNIFVSFVQNSELKAKF
jgi:hypothetical protein